MLGLRSVARRCALPFGGLLARESANVSLRSTVRAAGIAKLEPIVLEKVERWIPARRRELAAAGQELFGVIAYGPLVLHTSSDELGLVEIVEPLERATSRDLTNAIVTDPQVCGHIVLISISWADLKHAIAQRVPAAMFILEGYRVLADRGRQVRRYLREAKAA